MGNPILLQYIKEVGSNAFAFEPTSFCLPFLFYRYFEKACKDFYSQDLYKEKVLKIER